MCYAQRRNTSHVTRHTSHVTRHTSHITRHALHLQHMPNVTRQYGRHSVAYNLSRPGQVHQARVRVRFKSHQRAAAADLEQVLLHKEAGFVGEGQQLNMCHMSSVLNMCHMSSA